MTPPINIDGTQITGASIDGTDVSEITVDGTQVFLANAIPDSAINQYSFEDDSDTSTAVDSIGTVDGTINGATYTTNSQVGSLAMDFGTGSNEVAFGNSQLRDTAPLSVSLLANKANTNSAEIAFSIQGARFSVAFENKGSNGYEARVADGSTDAFITSGNTTTNSFVHLVLAYDGSTFEFFVDGSSVGTDSSVSGMPSSSAGDAIGNSQAGGSFPFSGIIDEVILFDERLSSQQVSNLFNSQQ